MKYRLAVILPTYLLMFAGCYWAAFQLRYEFEPPPEVVEMFRSTLAALIGVKLLMSGISGEWRRSYRYATLPDVFYVAASATGAAALIYLLNHFRVYGPIPRSVILIDWALSIPSAGLVRVAARLYTEFIRPPLGRRSRKGRLRTLVVGTGKEGIDILRTIQAADSEYHVVGLVDEGAARGRPLIAGVPVYSMDRGWKKLAARLSVQHVLIPGSVPGRKVREIVKDSAAAGFKAHLIPSVHEIVGGRFKLSVRDVTISDLLRRNPARLDVEGIRSYIEGRSVLITGAAGSIGSELCRQVLRLGPARLVLLDQSEFGIFSMGQELGGPATAPVSVIYAVADVTDATAIERIMREHRPELLFHAAAYKHVPLMEENPQEAIRNNVLGTRTVVGAAEQHGVERFVLISTDKAVRPTSVMGATKLVAEKCVQAASLRSPMQCITVRFGNVLNSAGSVVPTFRRQIEAGGPITVTHPDMQRFFMTIPEAVQLVLQAGSVGRSGDVLVLEMGEPCRIVDLARDMIALSGLKCPDDIEIVFTGVRPGEKLYEELFYDSEEHAERVHEKIFRATRRTPDPAEIDRGIARLADSLGGPPSRSASILWDIVARHVEADAAPAAPLKTAA